MHWYLVFTKPRLERCALQNLENQGYTCYLPTLPTERLRRGAVAIDPAPLFPRYLFIQLGQDASAKSWTPIHSTRGVSRLVRFGVEPAKVDERLIAALKAHQQAFEGQPERLFQPGERLRVASGPFTGLEAVYQMTEGDRRVLVLIELLCKPVELRLAPTELRKVA